METPKDLLEVAARLPTSESNCITGQSIVVDGGTFMH